MSATRSLPSLIAMLGTVDAVHGTYYVGLHFWLGLFGASPFSVRLPSALAVGATVAAVMLIARRLASTRIAIAAGIICAVVPRVTYMGAEARSSAFAAAVVAWLTALLLDLVHRHNPGRRWWIAYAALLAVGIYLFLYVALIVVAHAVILLTVRTDKAFLTRWVGSVAAALIAATPVFIWALLERKQIAFLGHRDEITFPKLAVSLWFGQPLFATAAWALIGCALAAAVVVWRSNTLAGLKGQFRKPRLDVVAASWLIVPAVILIGSNPVVPVYAARYLSCSAPAAAILMAIGLDRAVRGRTRPLAALLLAVVLCAAPVWISQRGSNAKNNSDFADIGATIAAHASPGDAIAFDESVRPSRRPRLAMHLYPADFAGLRDVTLDFAYDAGTSWYDTAYDVHDAAAHGRLDGVERVWLVEYAGPAGAHDADALALETLGYMAVAEYGTHRSEIQEYVLPGTVG
ncbi:glycosyltransferase family 39 protein [Cryobacterium lactosi]|nr:glycosyltransferase family 39 protein [Cryobacterium lactosi]